MTAENTIQWMMDFYPDIYPTRKHCLNQLFCVIGNGYKWKNGELVDTDPDEFASRYKFKKNIQRAESKHEERWDEMRLWHESWRQVDPTHQIPFQYTFEWYPVTEGYSYVVNFPEDITPSWKAALLECRELLAIDGVVVILEEVST